MFYNYYIVNVIIIILSAHKIFVHRVLWKNYIKMEKYIEPRVDIKRFFHFRGNSLRLVHVFWRLPEKTSHPFFEAETGVLTLFSKKGQKKATRPGRKKNFPSQEGRQY